MLLRSRTVSGRLKSIFCCCCCCCLDLRDECRHDGGKADVVLVILAMGVVRLLVDGEKKGLSRRDESRVTGFLQRRWNGMRD